ncbi:heat-shock protein [Trifolium medium]|uniref:Heat-shock protein n=1 Tax=Trifolium medium TaxID=97028 RepID=A0A392NVF9_9FABA|nr:heat-shock protein [Trifolium medium]
MERSLGGCQWGGGEVLRGGGRLHGFGMVTMMRGWFAKGIERRDDNGVETFFLSDPWLGSVPLSVRFRRLFDLSLNRSSTVAVMSELGWGVGGAAWLWRRRLWAWEEEMLEECRSLLFDIVLQPNVADQWVWQPDPGGGYSVRGAYDLLTDRCRTRSK